MWPNVLLLEEENVDSNTPSEKVCYGMRPHCDIRNT